MAAASQIPSFSLDGTGGRAFSSTKLVVLGVPCSFAQKSVFRVSCIRISPDCRSVGDIHVHASHRNRERCRICQRQANQGGKFWLWTHTLGILHEFSGDRLTRMLRTQVILVVSTCGLGEFPANCKQTWLKLQSQELNT